jgi:hypothetical protein
LLTERSLASLLQVTKDGADLVFATLADVLPAPGWQRCADNLVALLANGFKVGVVDWPRQEEIKSIVALDIIEDRPQRRLDLGTTKPRMSLAHCAVAPSEEDRTSGEAGKQRAKCQPESHAPNDSALSGRRWRA